jgi:glycerol-3-phosphate dehydrogenase
MDRSEALAALDGTFDLAIVGGGATGLGAAVDAASRGYRVALVEAHDFASATSSRSTKLVHGGVRYLERGDVGLVREALHERTTLSRIAPHLIDDLTFVIPAYKRFEIPYYALGLAGYDTLAGKTDFGKSRRLSKKHTLERVPHLRSEGLRGGIEYHDGRFDDARLALALARTAHDLGAVVANYVRCTGFVSDNGRLRGIVAVDRESGREVTIRARAVINATGIFADRLRALDDPTVPKLLALSRGSHVVLPPGVLGGDDALLVPKTDDGRVIFAIPWFGVTLLGTTDVPVESADLEPLVSDDEVLYLLDHLNRYLDVPVARGDVRATFAGLRPLVLADAASTAALSREHAIEVSTRGLVTIVGGKWTTYRRMASDVVDRAAREAGLPKTRTRTHSLPLHGAPRGRIDRADPLSRYGTDRAAIVALAAAQPQLAGRLHPKLPYLEAEVAYAAVCEMARTVEDVLANRTRALVLDATAAAEAAPRVATILAGILGRDDAWERAQVETFRALARKRGAALAGSAVGHA